MGQALKKDEDKKGFIIEFVYKTYRTFILSLVTRMYVYEYIVMRGSEYGLFKLYN